MNLFIISAAYLDNSKYDSLYNYPDVKITYFDYYDDYSKIKYLNIRSFLPTIIILDENYKELKRFMNNTDISEVEMFLKNRGNEKC